MGRAIRQLVLPARLVPTLAARAWRDIPEPELATDGLHKKASKRLIGHALDKPMRPLDKPMRPLRAGMPENLSRASASGAADGGGETCVGFLHSEHSGLTAMVSCNVFKITLKLLPIESRWPGFTMRYRNVMPLTFHGSVKFWLTTCTANVGTVIARRCLIVPLRRDNAEP